MCLDVLESLDDEGLDDLARGLGLEDAGLLGEGVDAYCEKKMRMKTDSNSC